MNPQARDTLCRMISHYGTSLLDEPRRCEGLLNDLCPQDKREVHVLLGALREQIPQELKSPQLRTSPLIGIGRLAKRLEQNLGLAEEPARWAVESWALALGVVTPEALQAHAAQQKKTTSTNSGPASQQRQPEPPRAAAPKPQPQPRPQPKPAQRAPAAAPVHAAATPTTAAPATPAASGNGGGIWALLFLVCLGVAIYVVNRNKKDPRENLRAPGQNFAPFNSANTPAPPVYNPAPNFDPLPASPPNDTAAQFPDGGAAQGTEEIGAVLQKLLQDQARQIEEDARNGKFDAK